jgi:hypothetical protein
MRQGVERVGEEESETGAQDPWIAGRELSGESTNEKRQTKGGNVLKVGRREKVLPQNADSDCLKSTLCT